MDPGKPSQKGDGQGRETAGVRKISPPFTPTINHGGSTRRLSQARQVGSQAEEEARVGAGR